MTREGPAQSRCARSEARIRHLWTAQAALDDVPRANTAPAIVDCGAGKSYRRNVSTSSRSAQRDAAAHRGSRARHRAEEARRRPGHAVRPGALRPSPERFATSVERPNGRTPLHAAHRDRRRAVMARAGRGSHRGRQCCRPRSRAAREGAFLPIRRSPRGSRIRSTGASRVASPRTSSARRAGGRTAQGHVTELVGWEHSGRNE